MVFSVGAAVGAVSAGVGSCVDGIIVGTALGGSEGVAVGEGVGRTDGGGVGAGNGEDDGAGVGAKVSTEMLATDADDMDKRRWPNCVAKCTRAAVNVP